mmetsp:Transcript_96345/g.272471  ORF Transcript_96345/g.272471 Transcript_96345/m.272471 type:complete len:287 (-) Transcript_96345:446-1306(-)
MVSIARAHVPKRRQRNTRNSWSSFEFSMIGCKTCAKKRAPMSSSTNSRVMDHASAPIDATTALTSTRNDLKAFMTRTTWSTFDNRTKRTSLKIPMFLMLSVPTCIRIQESMEDTTTMNASTKFANDRRYRNPPAKTRTNNSTKNSAVKACSKKPNIFSRAGQRTLHESQRPNKSCSTTRPRYSKLRDTDTVFTTMSTPTKRSKCVERTMSAIRSLHDLGCMDIMAAAAAASSASAIAMMSLALRVGTFGSLSSLLFDERPEPLIASKTLVSNEVLRTCVPPFCRSS